MVVVVRVGVRVVVMVVRAGQKSLSRCVGTVVGVVVTVVPSSVEVVKVGVVEAGVGAPDVEVTGDVVVRVGVRVVVVIVRAGQKSLSRCVGTVVGVVVTVVPSSVEVVEVGVVEVGVGALGVEVTGDMVVRVGVRVVMVVVRAGQKSLSRCVGTVVGEVVTVIPSSVEMIEVGIVEVCVGALCVEMTGDVVVRVGVRVAVVRAG